VTFSKYFSEKQLIFSISTLFFKENYFFYNFFLTHTQKTPYFIIGISVTERLISNFTLIFLIFMLSANE